MMPDVGAAASYSERLAHFIAAWRPDDLPEAELAVVRDCVLDQFGVQLVGSTLPWTRIVYDYANDIAGTGPCTVTGTSSCWCAPEAAFVNATFGHGCELDDLGHGRGRFRGHV